MTDKVKLVWLSHIQDKEEKERFKQAILSRQDIWDRLKHIVEDRVEAKEMHFDDYDSPSWAYKQAHANGYKEALLELYDILP